MFKVLQIPQKVNDIIIKPLHYKKGFTLETGSISKETFNDQELTLTLKQNCDTNVSPACNTPVDPPKWLTLDQKAFMLRGKAISKADIKKYDLFCLASDGFKQADVKAQFTLWVYNTPPKVEKTHADIYFNVTKQVKELFIDFSLYFSDVDKEDVLTYLVKYKDKDQQT